MAMATLTASYNLAVGHLWTTWDLRRGFRIGKHASRLVGATGYDRTCNSYASSSWGNSVICVVFGSYRMAAGVGSRSCSCGASTGGGFRLVQGTGNRRRESDKRWRFGAGRNEGNGSSNTEEDPEHGKQAGDEDEEVDQALNLDGQIPTTSDGFLKKVSSSAYDLRRQLEQNIESSSYDVLESNPWRETPKPVYVLATEENHLLTMRTRKARSEVERELGMLFQGGSRRGRQGREGRSSSSKGREGESSTKADSPEFGMMVEDLREGVLVFEDEEEAISYCSLLDGQGRKCAGVAELDASDVFGLCQKTQSLAVLFRRGTTPPQPDQLQLNLKARKRSLED
jgi:hypothetical protein